MMRTKSNQVEPIPTNPITCILGIDIHITIDHIGSKSKVRPLGCN